MFYRSILKQMNALMEQAFNIGAEIDIWVDQRDFGKDPEELRATTVATYEHLSNWLKDMQRLEGDVAEYEVHNCYNQEHSDYERTYHILSYVLSPLKRNLADAHNKIELYMLKNQIR